LRVVDLKASGGGSVSLQHRKPIDRQWYEAYVGTTGALKDRFKTNPLTVAALEFFIGGRVSVSRDTEVEIVTDRSLTSSSASLKRIVLVNGYMWFKAGPLPQPVEIQTNGGTMAIKGTEFTLESKPDSSTLSVLEGSVEVRDVQQKYLATARPGDIYEVSPTSEPKVTQMDPTELRRLREQGPLGEMAAIWSEFYSLDLSKARQLSNRLDEALNQLENKGKTNNLAPPFRQASEPTLELTPKGMQPNATVKGLGVLHWQPTEKADGYVVLISGDSDFQDILFSIRARDSQVVYPATARPLPPGIYWWRVVPVDAQDQPLPGASQASFRILPPG